MSEKQWACAINECKESWPKYTTIDAYRAYLRVNKVHPGQQCKPTK